MEKVPTDFDLNLLRILAALALTGSVSKAAHMLDMSQSGFSTALARLRKQFNDPLFIHTSKGMLPTPLGVRMAETAQAVLAQVSEGILVPAAFEPATAHTEFRLAMTDVAEIVFLPRLISHLQTCAPHATISCAALESEALKAALAAGSVDLALGYLPNLDSRGFFQQRFYTHTFACMLRRGHPLTKKPLTEAAYIEQGHAVVASPSRPDELFNAFLKARGIERRVVLHTPHHLSLPAIIEGTDLLATVPLAAGARYAQLGAVQLMALPFEPPSFPIRQHWHPLMHKDDRNRWLRAQIAALFSAEHDEWRATEAALYGADYRKIRPGQTSRAKSAKRPIR